VVAPHLLRGHGRLLGALSVEVTGSETRERLDARRAVVLATGSAPVVPPIEGLAEAHPWDNRGVTSATSVPRRLIALGGGVVGVEMAQAWRRLGAEEVTIIEAGERLLAHEEPFVGHQLQEAFEREGIAVMIGSPVVRVRRSDGEVRTTMEDGTSLAADELLVAVGRRPATKDLGLDSVGLEPGSPVEVDSHLAATGVDGGWLYAVGDVNGRALLTHMGKYQARVASDHITGRHVGDVDVADDRAVPRVIFTDPQVAAVGLTESAARARGMAVRTVSHDTGGVAGASVSGVGIAGTSHLVIDESRSVIVGATFTGPGVGELLHAATVAIVAEVPLERLWHAVPSYPTLSEVWLKLLEDYGL
jgi:pyruvate/2-oxoglutarate dehydrogenase complex dihydrolipoamide dehydrogenase (E3) component